MLKNILDWFNRRLEAIVDTIIPIGVVAGLYAVWRRIRYFPRWEITMIIISIIFTVVVIAIIVRAWIRGKNRNRNNLNYPKLVQQPHLQCAMRTRNILWKLHKRDLKLEKDTYKQYLRLFKSSDFQQLLTIFMGTTIFVPHKEKLAKVTKKIGGEKLSNDKVKLREQIDMVADKVHPAVEQEWTLEKMNAVGHLLDEFPKQQNATFRGITVRRAKDKQWQKSFNEITELEVDNPDIFNDKETKKMVDDCISYSYVGSSLLLYTQLIYELTPIGWQPTDYIASGAYKPEIEIENRMTKLINELEKRIRGEESGESGTDSSL